MEDRTERSTSDDLLEHLAVVATELADVDDVDETLRLIVERGEQLLTGCDGASVTLIGRHGVVHTPAASSRTAYDGDAAQHVTGEGPCLQAIADHRTVTIDDLETDHRWPAFRARALELGVRSMLSIRLFVTDASLGALDLYSREPHAFDRRSHLVGQVFAAHASVALKAALNDAGLRIAMQSRDVIGQAKGLVMARHRVTADSAFEIIRRLSQDRNERVRVLAARIAERGGLPPD